MPWIAEITAKPVVVESKSSGTGCRDGCGSPRGKLPGPMTTRGEGELGEDYQGEVQFRDWEQGYVGIIEDPERFQGRDVWNC